MNDRGSITLWILGLTIMVLFLGGISLDLWRAFEIREDLAAMADSAANAGASRVDAATYRETGVLELDGPAAVAVANSSLDAQQDSERITNRTIATSGAVLTVRLEGEVGFTLLRIFLGGGSVAVSATGSAEALPAS
ncbi:MAG: hypothetical protein HKN80_06280 [Acidimicrobiia bacterium]|nr:hypothetical protein [Acidimicrobiia bacterium]